MKTCSQCNLYHKGCDFSETENIRDFVGCGQFVNNISPEDQTQELKEMENIYLDNQLEG